MARYLIRLRAFCLGLALACLSLPAFADAQLARECQRKLPPTRIEVKAVKSKVRYDYGLSLVQVNQAASSRSRTGTILGFAKYNLKYRSQWGAGTLTRRDGSGCLRPQLTIELVLEPHEVYIAREFPKGSCAHQDILRHENTHVAINERKLDQVARDLKAKLRAFFGNQVYYGDVGTLQQQLDEAIATYWVPYAMNRMKEVEADHAALDSPEEYARNSVICDGIIPKVIAREMRAVRR